MIMAGGTGGHVYPALAVADELRGNGIEVIWLGTRAGLEARVVPGAGIPIEFICISGLRGKGVLAWLLLPFKLSYAVLQSLRVVMKHRPATVLGMGGFVTGPGGLASWLSRTPLLIHEQNAVAGMTNRWLARFASAVMEAFPGSFPASVATLHTGNPVRREITQVQAPEQRLAVHRSEQSDQGRLRLLVLGGSLGALALNSVLPEAIKGISEDHRPDVWHQAGVRNIEAARAAYGHAGVHARVDPFIEDMAEAYAWADLVVCRAGALTIAELAAVGVAAILIPFPHAVDDHQTYNADYLVRADAAMLVPQAELTPPGLGKLLEEFISQPQRIVAMACAGRDLAMPEATATVAQYCMEAAA